MDLLHCGADRWDLILQVGTFSSFSQNSISVFLWMFSPLLPGKFSDASILSDKPVFYVNVNLIFIKMCI